LTKFSAVKVKAESTLGMVVIGCTGTAAALSTLVLVFLIMQSGRGAFVDKRA